MAFPTSLNSLCKPALVYFVISTIGLALMILQNIGNSQSYNLGNFTCAVPNTTLVFIIKMLYVLFWTWILNLICKDGYTNISWLLVLFPFILMFVIIGLIMINR
jgi:hypothetical protein